MMFKTHVVFSIFISLLFIKYLNPENEILFFLLVIFFGVFPDIDEKKSKISRKTRILSWPLRLFSKHRGIFHSIFFPIIFLFVFMLSGFYIEGFAVVIGYLSHLLLDSVNYGGIKPFYPVFNYKIKGFMKSGKILDYLLFIIFLILDLVLLFSV